ncbi:MAG TPA: IS4 family transposase [Acidobacteriota bacterium]|nr:IS4 family transposase [Acidobacteriota bacterium]
MKKNPVDPWDLLACAGLSRGKVRQLAFETGFCKRASGKISAPDFLIHLCLQSVTGVVSYNDLAARIEVHTGVTASRQAYWERTDEPCVRFFQSILERVMLSKCSPDEAQAFNRQGRFKRILLHDSTIIKLPLRLFKVFSGVKNAHTAVCNARIQGIYDLLSGQFVQFSIDPYSKNDLASTLEIPVQAGDLVLRDRGYFTIEAIDRHKQEGADSIYRYKHGTALYDPATGQKIHLLELLTRNGSVDRLINAGPEQKTHLRLIAVPVPAETANLRRMKAKKEMSHAPSQELLKLMSWTIFLTTITDPSITFKEVLALYRLRWRIENIFKTWKSYFNFEKVHNVPEIQLRVLLNARLIMITLAYERLFSPLVGQVYRATGKLISLIKFTRYITQNLSVLPRFLNAHRLHPQSCRALQRYCTYEKRNRSNFMTDVETIFLKTGDLCA